MTGHSGPCAGQLWPLPPGEYDWIRMRFAPSTGDGELEDQVWLHYSDGVDPEWLRRPAGADECRIPVTRHAPLVALRLPDRPELYVRDLDLVPAPRREAE